MARGRSRRGGEYAEFWPAYVDVLSTLLLVVTLLMSLFMIAQYFAAEEAIGKDTALKRLTRQITESPAFSTSRKANPRVRRMSLRPCKPPCPRCVRKTPSWPEPALAPTSVPRRPRGAPPRYRRTSKRRRTFRVRRWPRSICSTSSCSPCASRLRRSTRRSRHPKKRAWKATRPSRTWASQCGACPPVQELQRYRSDFFGRLRDLLKDRKDIRVVGDRFVFESEVLFPSGSATLTPGRADRHGPACRRYQGAGAADSQRAGLDTAGQRAHRCAPDCKRAVPLQLGIVYGARRIGLRSTSFHAALRPTDWSPPALPSSSPSKRAAPKRPCSATAASSWSH